MNAPLVVFDTETAALHGAPHLIELGAVRVVDGEVTAIENEAYVQVSQLGQLLPKCACEHVFAKSL